MTAQAPLAAITGGTGFLGRYVVAAFREAGWRVRLLVRRDPTHPQLPELEAEVVMGDLRSGGDVLRRLSAGADAVVHLAGAIRARDRDGFFAVNERGSAAMGAAVAETAPDARLIQVSSLAAREPQLSDYAASKRAGEAAFATAAGRAVTVLRPGVIHGPWDEETLVLFRLAGGRLMPVPALPEARVSCVFAADVARAILAFAGAPRAIVGSFEVSDDRPGGYRWRDLARAAARALDREPRLVPVPRLAWPVAGTLVESLARMTGAVPMMSRGKVREMMHRDWSCAPDRLPPATLWTSRTGLDAGFARTVAWARAEGRLA